MNSLPRELTQIVSAYLDYRTYYALSIANKRIHSILTSEMSLHSYLQEKDLSTSELYAGVQHMATHLYLRCEDIDGTMKVTTLDDHRKILLPFSHCSGVNRDIFYRGFYDLPHSRAYKPDVQDVFYSEDISDNVYLYRNGDIELDGEIHSSQATKFVGLPLNEGIFYRNQEGYYCVLSYEGISDIHPDVPRPTTIKDIHCGNCVIMDQDYLHIDAILHHNGDFHRFDNDVVSTSTNINKVVYWSDEEYWMLTKDGRAVLVENEGHEIIYTYPSTSVTDIGADEYHLYVLEEGKSLFTLNKGFERKKMYEVTDVCDTLTLYEVDSVEEYHTIVCLHRE